MAVPSISHADANRIAACVNACAGIADSVLTPGSIAIAIEYSARERGELMVNLGCALEHRNELLSAVRSILIADAIEYDDCYYRALDAARAAIARAEGTQINEEES